MEKWKVMWDVFFKGRCTSSRKRQRFWKARCTHNLFCSVNMIGAEDLGEKFSGGGREAIRDFACDVIFRKWGRGYQTACHRLLENALIFYLKQPFSPGIPDKRYLPLVPKSGSPAKGYDGDGVWALSGSILHGKLRVPVCQGCWGSWWYGRMSVSHVTNSCGSSLLSTK